ncbi:hypothetical protein EDB80DRAFT_693540 [Ilyonectria destructans]|nr:hypothetical protein EDB80DRAFT_693540 [Ilyonectria destructans]
MVALDIVERRLPLMTIAARSASSDLVTQVRAVLACCGTASGQSEISDICIMLGNPWANEIFVECRKRFKTEQQWEQSEIIAELEHYLALTLDALNHADDAMLMVAIMLGEAEAFGSLGDIDNAEPTLDALKKILNVVRHMFQDHPWYDVYLQDFIGRTIMGQHRYAAAVAWFQSAFSVSAIKIGARDMLTIYVRQNLANSGPEARLCSQKHRPSHRGQNQNEGRQQKCFDGKGGQGGPTDQTRRYRRSDAASCRNTCSIKSKVGERHFIALGAIKKYKKALTGFKKGGLDPAYILMVCQEIASTRSAQGKPEKAFMILDDILESNSEPRLVHVERTLELASALIAMGKVADALLKVMDAQRLFRMFEGEDNAVKQFMLETEGECHQASGRFEEALRCYKEALQVAETQFRNPSHPDLIQVWKKIGDVKMKLSTKAFGITAARKYEQEAKQAYCKCYEGSSETFGSEKLHPKTAMTCLFGKDISPLQREITEMSASEPPIRQLRTMLIL